MVMEIDHVAVATSSIDKGMAVYRDLLHLEFHSTEVVEEQKVRAAVLMAGKDRVELLEATSDESPIAKHIEKRGEGLHHIAFSVENIETALEELKSSGARLIDEKPRIGAGGAKIAFLHPAATSGVLIELVERS